MKWIVLFLIFSVVAIGQEQATDFEFTTADGIVQKLSNYEGEVLYISFWATWCKPCLNNFEKYNKTREKLASLGVTLLNVSIDKDESKWKQKLETNIYLNGVNVHANDIESIQNIYNLYSIPAYEILNKSGQFVYLSQNGERDIFSEFEAWVSEDNQ